MVFEGVIPSHIQGSKGQSSLWALADIFGYVPCLESHNSLLVLYFLASSILLSGLCMDGSNYDEEDDGNCHQDEASAEHTLDGITHGIVDTIRGILK